jgi:hypothetical protein
MKLVKMLSAVAVLTIVGCGAGSAFARDARFDAIAVSDERGLAGGDAGYGVGQGHTQQEANAGAMQECRSHGNTNCKLVLTYPLCGAYASSRDHAGTGTGDSKGAAARNALGGCGRDTCKVVVSDCVNER